VTRVLFLNLYATLGGAENALLQLLAALDRRRFEPRVVVGSEGPLKDALQARQVPVEVVPFPARALWWLAAPGVLARDLRAALRLRRIVREHGVQVLHTGDVLGLLLALPARAGGVRVVYQVNHLGGWPRRALLSMLARLAVDHILVFSEAQRCEVLAGTWGLSGLTAVVRPGLSADTPGGSKAAAREALGLPRDRRLVGMAARFDVDKGHATFVAAAARLVEDDDVDVVIAGGALNQEQLPHVAAYRARVLEQIRRLGLERRVHVLGFVASAAELTTALDVLVCPSEREPFGMIVVEALALGTPVVVSDTGGPPEIVGHGRCGLVFRTGDPEALAAQVRRLLGDGALCEALVAAGRARARDAFSGDRYARDLEAVYDRVA
jgi:glycosyltransferase involved in cell wall biosynthesis